MRKLEVLWLTRVCFVLRRSWVDVQLEKLKRTQMPSWKKDRSVTGDSVTGGNQAWRHASSPADVDRGGAAEKMRGPAAPRLVKKKTRRSRSPWYPRKKPFFSKDTVNPEYFVRTQFSYPGLSDLSYAWNFRTVADRCGFSDLLCTLHVHYIFVWKPPRTKCTKITCIRNILDLQYHGDRRVQFFLDQARRRRPTHFLRSATLDHPLTVQWHDLDRSSASRSAPRVKFVRASAWTHALGPSHTTSSFGLT